MYSDPPGACGHGTIAAMPSYDLTFRYDAEDDRQAMATGVQIESQLDQMTLHPASKVPALRIEQLSRVVVERMLPVRPAEEDKTLRAPSPDRRSQRAAAD